jgi:uncharacterized protein (DUF39 family)
MFFFILEVYIMEKTVNDINEKIRQKKAVVFTADEMTKMIREIGAKNAAEKVDVVTSGTFGAMCSSGVWMNFGHSDPPIRMQRVTLNGVKAYSGVAAVDAYIGATQPSETQGLRYGGAHVIEDLIKGKAVRLEASSSGTDCYPRKEIRTATSLDNLNQAIMCNPRNAYQKYNAAANSGGKTLYTYMGRLLPRLGNITYSGAGEISPISNDPSFRTIGIGTKIFLGGCQGYIAGSGTQHDPENGFSTLMVHGNLKSMKAEFIRAAVFPGYGCTLYIGIGVPIPVLNIEIAQNTGISDEEIMTDILDYAVPSRSRPVLKKVSYRELKSGKILLNGKSIRTSSLSSLYMAKKIAKILKGWIEDGHFFLTQPADRISCQGKD